MFVSGLLPVPWFVVVALIALLVALSSSLLLLLLFRHLLPIFVRPFLFFFSLSHLFQDILGFFGLLLRPICSTSGIIVDSFVFGLIDIGISHTISIHPMIVMQAPDMLQVAGIADQTSFCLLITLVR